MKNTLIKIKNKETAVEWMKLGIKSMIWNIRKQKQPIRKTRRKENLPPPPKKEDRLSSLWNNLKGPTFTL